MVRGLVPYASYSRYFNASPFSPQDLFTTFPHLSDLPHPLPHLHVPVPPALLEVAEDFHHPKLHQKVSDLLAARVLGFADVSADVPDKYGLLDQKSFQGLLQL